jgi:hypothetical protein
VQSRVRAFCSVWKRSDLLAVLSQYPDARKGQSDKGELSMKATIDGIQVSGTTEEIKRFKELCEGKQQTHELTTWHPYWQGMSAPSIPPIKMPKINIEIDHEKIQKVSVKP